MQKANQVERQEGIDDELPEQLARREHLRQKIQQAKRAIKAREKAKAVEGQATYLKKKAAHQERNAGGGRRKGSPPNPPSDISPKPKLKAISPTRTRA